jgi:hypothetical protein
LKFDNCSMMIIVEIVGSWGSRHVVIFYWERLSSREDPYVLVSRI